MKLKNREASSPTSLPSGFTLVEIMIVVAIIGLLSAIAVPNFVHARTTSQLNTCIQNLHQIDAAIQRWALENNQPSGASVSDSDIIPYVGRGTAAAFSKIYCPADSERAFATSYRLTDISTQPACQILPGPGRTTHSIN